MFIRLRSHLSYANVMATVAVFFALGGTSYAIIITGAMVQDGSLTGDDIATNSVSGVDITNLTGLDVIDDSLRGADIDEATLSVVQGRERVTAASVFNANDTKGATVFCPAGKKVMGAGAEMTSGTPAALTTINAFSSDRVTVTARETVPFGGNWLVVAQAICATAP
jgi:hypothetical protein